MADPDCSVLFNGVTLSHADHLSRNHMVQFRPQLQTTHIISVKGRCLSASGDVIVLIRAAEISRVKKAHAPVLPPSAICWSHLAKEGSRREGSSCSSAWY